FITGILGQCQRATSNEGRQLRVFSLSSNQEFTPINTNLGNPERIGTLSPGLRGTSYPGAATVNTNNPEGVSAFSLASNGDATPLGLENYFAMFPRLAPQPGAERSNPCGIQNPPIRIPSCSFVVKPRGAHGVTRPTLARAFNPQGAGQLLLRWRRTRRPST